MIYINKSKLYLKPIHQYAYRHNNSDTGVEITGVYFIKPNEKLGYRPCYEITYQDGFVDYVPVSEVENGNWTFYVIGVDLAL